MPQFSVEERLKKSLRAVQLHAQGTTDTDIALELGVTRKTVKKLREDEYALRAEHRAQDKEKSIAVYEEVKRAAWERFRETDNRSLNASGYLNTIKGAQERIDRITGAEAPIKVQDVDEEYEIVFADSEGAISE